MKKILLIVAISFLYTNTSFADSYEFFYGKWCPHCIKVESFFEKENINKTQKIISKEVYFDENNRNDFMNISDELNIPESDRWVPTLIIFNDNNKPVKSLAGDELIINYFKKIKEVSNKTKNTSDKDIKKGAKQVSFMDHISFFGILLPAAISDSINPCEFAVMLLLLSAILIKHKSRRRAILAWLMFSLAVFLSYFLMWIWLYSALSSVSNVFYMKLWVGILWIIVWLANLKDYLWYWKWFVMEVPFSWRPNMKKILNSTTSPIGAFFIWILVSLFLLPCTSWPYLVILGYLSSQSKNITTWWYIYLFVYNLFFILPMIVITWLVWFGVKSITELDNMRDNNIEKIHLIVWFLMIALGGYVILQAYNIIPF